MYERFCCRHRDLVCEGSFSPEILPCERSACVQSLAYALWHEAGQEELTDERRDMREIHWLRRRLRC